MAARPHDEKMVNIVASDLRVRLAADPFKTRFAALSDRVRLLPYAQLMDDLDLDAAYVLCSASSFTPFQREAAMMWESAVAKLNPPIQVFNRPGRVRPWNEEMADLAAEGRSAFEVRSLREQMERPKFPMVLRQLTSEFHLESPVIENGDAFWELLDRMILSGGTLEKIWAVQVPINGPDRLHESAISILRIGEIHFYLGGDPSPDATRQMRAIVERLPLDVAMFDFMIGEVGPQLFRIDDELWRILPSLEGERPTSDFGKPNVAIAEALAALSSSGKSDKRAPAPLDPNQVASLFR